MRIALVSDIHGCIVALDAVLADIAQRGVDRIVCLGDIADLGPWPRACLERIRERDCPTLMGNHDPFYDGQPVPPIALHEWSKAQLEPGDLAWLRGLPDTLRFDLGHGRTLLAVHGSPRSYDHQIVAGTPDEKLDDWLADADADVVVCGHTHVQLHRRHRGIHVVNVGSVGMPFVAAFDGKSTPKMLPWSEYAIVSCTDGEIDVALLRVDYDVAAFAESARTSDLPDPEHWLEAWSHAIAM